jgi:hypothetical protein
LMEHQLKYHVKIMGGGQSMYGSDCVIMGRSLIYT